MSLNIKDGETDRLARELAARRRMSDAVAKIENEPLLFKGDDFAHTDIPAAAY